MPAPSGSTAVWPGKPSLAAGTGFKKFFEDLWTEVTSLLASRTNAESAWTPYTPTLTNVTLGTGGSATGSYKEVGKTTYVRIIVTLGTGGTVGGNVTVTLPSVPLSNLKGAEGWCRPTGGDPTYPIQGISTSATNVLTLRYFSSPGSGPVALGNFNATTPGTWGSGAVIVLDYVYERA